MSIMVTGGKGFIGRRLVEKLEKNGNKVVVVDKENDGILNREYLSESLKDVSLVFHLGAVSGSIFFSDDPVHAVRVNCEGTVNLLEMALKAGVKRVVFAGTMSAYGFTPIPHMEDGPISCPNAYVASKIFGEKMMRLYFENRDLETVLLRFASVYGMGEETKKGGIVGNPLTQFIWSVLSGKPPKIFDKGTQTRDLVFVDDVVSALMAAATFGSPGDIYNVATDVETSMNEAIDILSLIHGIKIRADYVPYKPYDQQKIYIDRQRASFEKLHQATGWKPRFDVQMGAKIAYHYYKEHPELVPEFFRR